MEDQRIRYTKSAIRDAFAILLSQKKIDEITVSEICQKAEINRATFYRYYTSPYNLLDSLQGEIISVVISRVEGNNFDFGTMLRAQFRSMYNNRQTWMPFFSGYSKRLFSKMNDYMDDLFDIHSKSEIEQMSYHFLVHGMCGLFSDWVSSGMTMDPDTFADNVILLCGSMYSQFNKQK